MSIAGRCACPRSCGRARALSYWCPLNSSKITSSMREPVSMSAVAMIVSEPPPRCCARIRRTASGAAARSRPRRPTGSCPNAARPCCGRAPDGMESSRITTSRLCSTGASPSRSPCRRPARGARRVHRRSGIRPRPSRSAACRHRTLVDEQHDERDGWFSAIAFASFRSRTVLPVGLGGDVMSALLLTDRLWVDDARLEAAVLRHRGVLVSGVGVVEGSCPSATSGLSGFGLDVAARSSALAHSGWENRTRSSGRELTADYCRSKP